MSKHMIQIENVEYAYKSHEPASQSSKALADINITIQKGEFVAVIGRNASGKSTMARLLNALLIPSHGIVYVNGIDTRDATHLWEIRRMCGMVFQNPENQFVGTIVEEDVAFGPENLGVPPEMIRKRVEDSLKAVGMAHYSTHAPHLLSGGQKQRVAIAGVLAMKPECIILDEATAMLDPLGRKEVMQVLKELNQKEKITIIHITHHMDEANMADRVIVVSNGRIELSGTPCEVFSNVEHMKTIGLEVPQVTELFHELNKEGYNLPLHIRDVEEAIKYIKALF